MAVRLRFLLDTNILIPLQDSMVVLNSNLTNFVRLCNAHGHQLLYHPASVEDIQRDTNAARRARTLNRLRQYTEIQRGLHPCPWNAPETSVNDACDNEILYALSQSAAHALVTEDQALHRKAREKGLGTRVYFIQSADDWLKRLHEPAEVRLPHIQDVELHTIVRELDGPFFDSIRSNYPPFNVWFNAKAQEGRRAWVYRDGEHDLVSAICVYAIQENERINDEGARLAGPALKLCTFKVGEVVRGRKIGELFLRAAFQYATTHQCEHIFLHANDEQQIHLKSLIEDFGFSQSGHYGHDGVYVKRHPVLPPPEELDRLEYVRRYYPHFMEGLEVRKFLVPIRPEFHNVLFPDYLRSGHALGRNDARQHVGNAIKLAYLCRTNSKRLRPGDLVLFYRSRDHRAVTSIGVVESYQSSTSAVDIAQIVSRRTVYSERQIVEMAERETKVMLFRLVRHFAHPVSYDELHAIGAIRGPTQSITQLTNESFSRILESAGR